ncbi:aminotransferase class V-fold PLP-dependent enzyme [Ornithinimicrobium avium]|uniref:aminotransferase class V-fold PLP-dependent enzyme n=1 Tax=Ornithinimicrobium avium TaxID=2283195 RepID=UPI00192E17C1|nr:aminotransferase class V-fold PLP-dependent enzyme [Ornithinimicrobium avium]
MAGAVREIYGEEFEGARGFLNSATYGLPSRRQLGVLRERLARWESGEMSGAEFDEPVAASRAAFASLAGVPVATVAMGGSVSALVGLVAASVPDGARVATLPGEFTSVTAPFTTQAARGVSVTTLAPGDLEARAGEFDVVAASLVQSADGRVLDTGRLRSAVRDRDTLVLLDVTQAMGWMDLDVAWADAVVGGSYKWLLAPRGAAWMALSGALAGQTVPHAAGWYSGPDPWSQIYTFPALLAPDARRFDTSPAWFTVLGAAVSMPWLAGLEMAAVEQHCVGLANQVRAAAGMEPSNSSIVALHAPGLADRLAGHGVRAAVRAGSVRVSFHLYTTQEDADALVEVLDRLAD